jgi:hypothetical protein
MRRWPGVLLILLLAACSGNNATNTAPPPAADSTAAASSKLTYPPTTGRIRIIMGDLPEGTDYFVLEPLHVETGWYGELDEAKRLLADRARKLGADAVIKADVWHSPSGISWASPHGKGLAVKLRQPESVDLEAVPGWWF